MRILGYDYKVILTDAGALTDKSGVLDVGKQEIRIDASLASEQQISTLIHEVIEALSYHLELKLKHPAIMGLEAGLYQCLRDNGVDLSVLLRGNAP